MPTTKIDNLAYALTMDAERRIIADAAILIRGDSIAAVGKAADMRETDADETIDARHFLAVPGFIGGHMHISYAHAVRGIFPDDLGADYLPSVFALQAAMTPDEERLTSLLAITELLKYGTTTFVDPGTTQHLDACMDAYATAGCRIVSGIQLADMPNPLNIPVSETAAALTRARDFVERYDGALGGMMSAWTMPFSPDFASADLMRGCAEIARELGVRMTTHHTQTDRSRERWVAEAGYTPTEHLAKIGALGEETVLAHALGISESDVEVIADSGASVVMCPTAALKSGSGMTRSALLPELLAAGVPAALGTDAANNSNLIETMRSMYLAAVLYKDARQDVSMMPAETALELATITAARALGMDDRIGSLEPGKKADIVLFDTRRPEWRSLLNPVNNLVYSADGRSVHTVIVNGETVVRNHIPTFVDEWELAQRVQTIGESLLNRVGVSFPPRWPVS